MTRRLGEPHRRGGFTLVELSIVLAMVALLAGVVVVGKDLIENGKLRSHVAEVRQIEAAYNTFRLKYGAVPGDMAVANGFWPGLAGTCGCNGNGDGMIENYTEAFRAWQHLSASGLINGAFTYVYDGDTAPGRQVPHTVLRKDLGFWLERRVVNGDPWRFAHFNFTANYLTVRQHVGANHMSISALTGTEASRIDAKTDDGAPLSGRALAYPLCVVFSSGVPTNQYRMTTTTSDGCTPHHAMN